MQEINGKLKEEGDNLYDRYKEAYEKDDIFECIMLLLRIGKSNDRHFKKGMLLSNSLGNPIGMRYNEKDYKKTMHILTYVYKLADDVSEEFKKTLYEFIIYTEILFKNNNMNTKRLHESEFFKYSLSQQLRMLCIHIQDQNRLMQQEISKNKEGYITGMESSLARYSVEYNPMQKISLDDNYEGLLEYTNTLFSYLYFKKKDDFNLNDICSHGDIHHFNIPAFSEIICIAQQRTMYMQFEEKFRYSQWMLHKGRKDDKTVYYLSSSNDAKTIAHHTAIIRRSYKEYSNAVIRYSSLDNTDNTIIDTLSDRLNIDKICDFHFEKKEYEKASVVGKSSVEMAKSVIKDVFCDFVFDGVDVDEILKTYVYLYTFSKVYMNAVMKTFDEEEYASYKYIVPVIDIEYFVKEIAFLLDVPETKANKSCAAR